MTLYFAYGSAMNRRLMRELCPAAVAWGPAELRGWMPAVMRGGYASIAPKPGRAVHGVLWRIPASGWAGLDAYEDVARGLYRRRILRLRQGARTVPAVVYVGKGEAFAPPAYRRLVINAARQWHLPPGYIATLSCMLSRRGGINS